MEKRTETIIEVTLNVIVMLAVLSTLINLA